MIPATARLVDDNFYMISVIDVFSMAFGYSKSHIRQLLKQNGLMVNKKALNVIQYRFHQDDILSIGHQFKKLHLPMWFTTYEDEEAFYIIVHIDNNNKE